PGTCSWRPGRRAGLEGVAVESGVVRGGDRGRAEAMVLEERGDALAPEAKGVLGGQGLGIGHAADSIGAEEAGHQRSRARPIRTMSGLTRSTVTPAGTTICSGPSRSIISPGRAPARLTRTRIESGETRARVVRRPWICTSTVSGASPVTTRPAGSE